MDYYALSDENIAAELGHRISRLRQRRGYSSESLAEAIGIEPEAIALLEKGKCDLTTLVAVMRELRAFGQLERFLKETRIRALELSNTEFPSAGTVLYRRRKADFKATKASSERVVNPRRKSDFTRDGEEKAVLKQARNPDISAH
jgi:transcriptional regulator with XRE-family HTH domain